MNLTWHGPGRRKSPVPICGRLSRVEARRAIGRLALGLDAHLF